MDYTITVHTKAELDDNVNQLPAGATRSVVANLARAALAHGGGIAADVTCGRTTVRVDVRVDGPRLSSEDPQVKAALHPAKTWEVTAAGFTFTAAR